MFNIEEHETQRDNWIDIFSVYAPLLIPLIPAGLIFISILQNYGKVLHLPFYAVTIIALLVAIGLEIFGIVSVETYGALRNYESIRDNSWESAPLKEAKTICIVYVGIVLTFLLLLEITPRLAEYFLWPVWIGNVTTLLTLLPLAVLSYLTVQSLVIRKQHNQRLKKYGVVENNEVTKLTQDVFTLEQQLEESKHIETTLTQNINTLEQQLEENKQNVNTLKQQLEESKQNVFTLEQQLADVETLYKKPFNPNLLQPSHSNIFEQLPDVISNNTIQNANQFATLINASKPVATTVFNYAKAMGLIEFVNSDVNAYVYKGE